jgi:transposase-like protein
MGTADVHHDRVKNRPLAYCPNCHSDRLGPEVDLATEEVHFVCRNCGTHWLVELGYARRVTPTAG